MFGKKENDIKTTTKVVNSNSSNITYISPDCEIRGSFISKGNARIDGQLEGKIKVSGDLTIGKNALIRADIEAQNISIAGETRGNIKAHDLLEISSSARLYGDIIVKQLKIDQGARFVGSSSYEENIPKDSYSTSSSQNAKKEK